MRLVRFAAASAALTMAVGAFAVSTAFADNPHFTSGPDFSIVGNTIQASGTIAGAGKNESGATITLTAEAMVGCKNSSGKLPKGHIQSVTSGAVPFTSDNSGHIVFTVTTAPVTAKCPGKMTPTVINFISATLTANVDGMTLTATFPAA
jgi:hypothetical protein